MLAKSSSVQQQQPRRTPLSLSTTMKPTKANEKNDNNKKETTTNNQKTENSKKDSQLDRKLSTDKKQSSTESKRSSSTSSTDSKKLEGNKIQKNEDNKKNQNGVNGNGIKDKPNTPNANEGTTKSKPESSSNGSASKKDTPKSTDKKKDPVVEVVTKNDNKDKPIEKVKDNKNEENKNKSAEKNKEKTVDVSNTTNKNQENTMEKKEEAKVVVAEKKSNDEKVNEEKKTPIKSPEKTAAKETNIIDQEVAMLDLEENNEKKLPLETQMTEETTVSKTPIKEKKVEETPNLETPLPEELLEDVEMMEPLQFIEEPTSCNIFAVSTPAKNRSPKEAQHLFELPSKLSPKSEVKPTKAPLTHTPDRKSCPRTFSSISGRRSIRPIGDYTFSGNLQIRESYRKINTELDFTSSSLNVTVGSEVPNNESFSFFSRSRKRDRSSPTHKSAMEVQSDHSPKSPKRARIDIGMSGFFNAMASPITMLRARLARASVQSTPKKQIVDSMEQEIVENVSAIAVEAVDEELTATEEQTFNPDSTVADTNEQCEEPAKCAQNPAIEEIDDIKIKETITATDSQAKKKCSIM